MSRKKSCYVCKRQLDFSEFRRDASRSTGLASRCRGCDNRLASEREARKRAARVRLQTLAQARRRVYAATAKVAIARARRHRKPSLLLAKPKVRLCKLCGVPAMSNRHPYCAACRDTKWRDDRRKANNRARGYGNAHQRLKKQLKPVVATGRVKCARCGKLIDPLEPWDLGHDDLDRSRWTGPEHRRCNRATWQRQARRSSRAW